MRASILHLRCRTFHSFPHLWWPESVVNDKEAERDEDPEIRGQESHRRSSLATTSQSGETIETFRPCPLLPLLQGASPPVHTLRTY
jgi:hypothetical protein